VLAYRAYKFPWKESVKKPSFTHFEVKEGNTYSFNNDSITTGIEITYTTLPSPDYNEATITRLPYGPMQPQFFDDLISVKPVSILYEVFAINSQVAEIHIDLAQYPEIKNPYKTGVFRREFPNQGLFVMLPTSYDSLANELITTTTGFGEFVFGETDLDYSPQNPIPYEPSDKQKVLPLDSLAIRWIGQGFYDSFKIQVSTDSTFENTLIDSTLKSSLLYPTDFVNHTKYFWRIRSILDSEKSEWSLVWSFETTDAFITLCKPNGEEVWPQETSPIIRWETNISDSVQLDLLYEGQNILSIGKTQGSHHGFRWLIPSDLAVSSFYKIQIMSLEDSSIIDTSDNPFSITSPTEIETISYQIPDNYALLQNYPNPFNPSTVISWKFTNSRYVKLSVYNILGEKVAALVSEKQQAGLHQYEWDARNMRSGIYFYRIKAGEFQDVKKMILLR